MHDRVAVVGNAAHTLIAFRLDLIKDLAHAGYTVYAFSPNFTQEQSKQVVDVGGCPIHYDVSRKGSNPVRELGVIYQLYKLMRKYKIDITLSYFIKPVVYGTIAAKIAGVRNMNSMIAGMGYAFTEDSSSGADRRKILIRGLLQMTFRLVLNLNNKVFVQNPDDYQFLLDKKLIKKRKAVIVNGSGINLERYMFKPPAKKPVVFITSGRLLREKGFHEFMQAAKILKVRYDHLKFIVLGGTDENPNSLKESEMQKYHSEGTIEWPGMVDSVYDWLTESSVFVLASYYREGTPRSILEALSVGRAVITTNLPGCRETVIEGVNGFLVPPRDPVVLAEKMEMFIKNPELITQMGKKSREIAEEKYDVRKVNHKMMHEMGLI